MKSGFNEALVQLNSKTSLYRGFTITKLPRKKPYNRQRYQITFSGDYFGIDFALAEAIRTVDMVIGIEKCPPKNIKGTAANRINKIPQIITVEYQQ